MTHFTDARPSKRTDETTDLIERARSLIEGAREGQAILDDLLDANPGTYTEYAPRVRILSLVVLRDKFAHLAKALQTLPERKRDVVPTHARCGDCDGCGWTEGGPAIMRNCSTCGGSGVIPISSSPAEG